MKSKATPVPSKRQSRRRAPRKPTAASGPIHDILVPVDFSKASRATLRQAALMAKALPGKITLLHAEEPPNYGGSMGELPGSVLSEFPIAPARLVQRLMALARDTIPPALFSEALVVQGAAGESIVTEANRRGSSLIVLSTHGYSGLKRVLLGSTAEYVVRHSSCPVLTTRRAGAGTAKPRLKSILAPVDHSAFSRKASDYAATLAARLGARLTLLHVVPPIASSGRRPLEESQLNARAAEGAKAELAQLAQQLEKTAPRIATLVATGDSTAEILRVAEKSAPDLIVVATHARGGIGRFLLGSTAENIVRHAPCPVLVVRQPKPTRRSGFNPLVYFPVAPVLP
jgi:nucleotide-binding universal stress UspA family protein